MGLNGYQGQICAADQNNRCFAANQEIFTLIQDLAHVEVDYLERVGIQAPPGTMILINNSTASKIEIGKTGLYEADDVEITSLKFLEDSPESVIIDFIISRAS